MLKDSDNSRGIEMLRNKIVYNIFNPPLYG